MKRDYTHISMLLDRSGSMLKVWDDTIGGMNHYTESQKKQPGRCTVTLAQFDDEYEVVFSRVPIHEVAPRTRENYTPRGWTALHDSLVRLIDETGEQLSALAESERPAHVLVVTQTDGQENMSKRYTAADVRARIEHQRATYHWEFVFLGANQDAILTAEKLGIARGASLTYAANSAGVRAMMDSLATATANYGATGQSIRFTEADRANQVKAGANPDAANDSDLGADLADPRYSSST